MPTALNGRPRLRGEAIGVAHSSPLPPRIDLVAVAEGGARLVLEAGSLRPISHSVVRLAVINGGWEIGSWMGFSIVEDELRGRYALFRAYGACKPIAVLSEIAAGWDLAGRAAIYLPEEVFSRLRRQLPMRAPLEARQGAASTVGSTRPTRRSSWPGHPFGTNPSRYRRPRLPPSV